MDNISKCLLELSLKNFKELTDFQEPKVGGQKYVFKCKHNVYGDVVLKYIICKSGQDVERAKREIETCYKLKSNNFAKIYKHGLIKTSDEKLIYIIEEFICGKTLKDLINEKNKLDESEALDIGLQLLNALNELHLINLVHRDVKPENIIIRDKQVFLLDMGIIRDLDKKSITSDLAMFGPMTLGYAAPEQIANEKYMICNRTDLFSWGVVMYECLEGINPFCKNCSTPNEILTKTLKYKPEKLSNIRKPFSEVIDLCLNKAVHRRPKSCEFIKSILDQLVKVNSSL